MSSDSTSSESSIDSDVEEELNNLKLDDEKEFNILLVGPTGVGKSTFINAVANYLSIKYFQDAERDGLVKLIPSKYKIKDKHSKEHEIQIGKQKDKNESLQTSESATQNVKPYVFPIWRGKVKVRFIDTPGIGDTRGIEQDEKNCDGIVNYIKKLGKIHAICFLCKPTNVRKTTYFDYCIYQILSRLEKEAAKNLFFLFTATRGSNYTAGDTLSILETVVKDIQDNCDLKIDLQKKVYCFDNEGFRFLGAVEKNVIFDEKTKEKYIKSWIHSAKECWKFIHYIQRELKPYIPTKLDELNLARNTLFEFSKILSEVKQVLNDNHNLLDRINTNKQDEQDMIKQLMAQKTKVAVVSSVLLSNVALVCTAKPSCVEVYKVNGIEKCHYKKICHNCYEVDKNVSINVIGCPDLFKCHFIDNYTRKCTSCGCDVLLHMFTDSVTTLTENFDIQDDVNLRIAKHKSLISNYDESTLFIALEMDHLEREQEAIKKFCVKLATYVTQNAILAFSKCYGEYIVYLLNQQKALGGNDVNKTKAIANLEKFKNEYFEVEDCLKLAPQSITDFDMKEDSFSYIFNLQNYGKKLHDTYVRVKHCIIVREAPEYVHEKYFVRSRRRNLYNSSNRNRDGNHGRRNDRPERPDSRCSTSSNYSTHYFHNRGRNNWSNNPQQSGNRRNRSQESDHSGRDKKESSHNWKGNDNRERDKESYNRQSKSYQGPHQPPPPPYSQYPPSYNQHPPPPPNSHYQYSAYEQQPPPPNSYGQYPPPPHAYSQHPPPPNSYGQTHYPSHDYGQHRPPPNSYSQTPHPSHAYGQYPPPPDSYDKYPRSAHAYDQHPSSHNQYNYPSPPPACNQHRPADGNRPQRQGDTRNYGRGSSSQGKNSFKDDKGSKNKNLFEKNNSGNSSNNRSRRENFNRRGRNNYRGNSRGNSKSSRSNSKSSRSNSKSSRSNSKSSRRSASDLDS